MSNECYFDEELYSKTGHGGHCINCRDNRGGIHCEQCLPNHYINKRTNRCTPCECDETGSEDLQCDEDGQCLCKPGVTGQVCDRCEDNYYDFSVYGCRLVFKCFLLSMHKRVVLIQFLWYWINTGFTKNTRNTHTHTKKIIFAENQVKSFRKKYNSCNESWDIPVD